MQLGQTVLLRHLGHGGADQGHLRRAHRGGGVAQVHRRRRGAVDDRRAALGELRQGDAGQHLGVVHHQGAGQGDGRRAAGQRHGEDRVREAQPRALDDHLGGVTGQLQWAHRAGAEAHDGIVTQGVEAAGDAGAELGADTHLPAAGRLGADALARVEQRRLAPVHGRRGCRHVGRPDGGGVLVDVRQRVHEPRGVAGVGLGRIAALAAARVDVHDALVEVAEAHRAVVVLGAAGDRRLDRPRRGSGPFRSRDRCSRRRRRRCRAPRRPRRRPRSLRAPAASPRGWRRDRRRRGLRAAVPGS